VREVCQRREVAHLAAGDSFGEPSATTAAQALLDIVDAEQLPLRVLSVLHVAIVNVDTRIQRCTVAAW
jgi:hypothetical protein